MDAHRTGWGQVRRSRVSERWCGSVVLCVCGIEWVGVRQRGRERKREKKGERNREYKFLIHSMNSSVGI